MKTVHHLTFAQLGPADGPAIRSLYLGLHDESRALRFGTPMPRIRERVIQPLCYVDGDRHAALGAYAGRSLVAVAHRIRSPVDPELHDVAFVVADAFQGRGIGSLLFDRVTQGAVADGVTRLAFHLSGDNRAMARLLSRKGVRVHYRAGSGEGYWSASEIRASRSFAVTMGAPGTVPAGDRTVPGESGTCAVAMAYDP